MSSHFLLQHVQIFLAKNARRQPTGMTEKGTNFRRNWDTSLNICNEPTETKIVFAPQFYITDVKCTSSKTYLRGQPYSSASHHQLLAVTPPHYVHSGLGLKLILQVCTWKLPSFLGTCSNSQWFQTKASTRREMEARVQAVESRVKGRQGLRIPFKWVLATTSAFTMKASLRKWWGTEVTKSNHHPCHSTWTDIKEYLWNRVIKQLPSTPLPNGFWVW